MALVLATVVMWNCSVTGGELLYRNHFDAEVAALLELLERWKVRFAGEGSDFELAGGVLRAQGRDWVIDPFRARSFAAVVVLDEFETDELRLAVRAFAARRRLPAMWCSVGDEDFVARGLPTRHDAP